MKNIFKTLYIIRCQYEVCACKEFTITTMFGSVLEIASCKSSSGFNQDRYFVLMETNFESQIHMSRSMETESKY